MDRRKTTNSHEERTLIDAGSGGVSGISVTAPEGVEAPVGVSGTVTDENGNPIEGIAVNTHNDVLNIGYGGMTDSNGRFFIDVAEGYDYVFYADTYDCYRSSGVVYIQGTFQDDDGVEPWVGTAGDEWTDIYVGPEGISDISIILEKGEPITGIILDTYGEPTDNLVINAHLPLPDGNLLANHGTVREDGTFYITTPQASGYEIHVHATAHEPTGFVNGHFIDDDGVAPWIGTTISVYTGNWEDITLIDVGPGGVTGMVIRLQEGAFINAVVTDTSGKPLEGVNVHAHSEYTQFASGERTDENGAVTVTVLKGNGYHLDIDAADSQDPTFLGGYFLDYDGTAPWVGGATQDYEERSFIDVGPEGVGVSIALEKAAIVSGVFKDPDGQPLPSVQICIFSDTDNGFGEWSGTDENGAFSMAVPPNLACSIYIDDQSLRGTGLIGGYFLDADGSAPWSGTGTTNWEEKTVITAGGSGSVTDVSITLERGEFVSGTVTGPSGQPVPSAYINLFSESIMASGWGETDENGEFSITVPEGPAYSIDIDVSWSNPQFVSGLFLDGDGVAPWSGSTTFTWENRTLIDVGSGGVSDISITLMAGVKIHGSITDPDGNPPQWVSMEAYSASTDNGGRAGTDASGNFSITVPPAADYYVEVFPGPDDDFYGGFWKVTSDTDGVLIPNQENATPVDVSSGDAEVNIALNNGFVISGHVTDDAGNPLSGMGVDVSSEANSYGDSVSTDSEGNYQMVLPPASDYRVGIWSTGTYMTAFYQDAFTWEDATLIKLESGSVADINFVLTTGESISGTLSGLESGNSAQIDVWSQSVQHGGTLNVTGTGSAKGFSIGGLIPASDYTISIMAEGYQGGHLLSDGSFGPWEDAALISTGTSDVSLALSIGRNISGTLSGVSPGDYLWVDAYSESADMGVGIEVVADANTAEFTISGLAHASDYRVSVNSDAYVNGFYQGPGEAPVPWNDAALVDVTANDASGIDIVMASGYSISGTITGLAPDARAWVDAWSESTGFGSGVEVIGTGGDVTYEIRGLDIAEDFKVSIGADGYVGGFYSADGMVYDWNAAALLDSSANPADISFAISEGKSISGTIIGLGPGEWAMIDVRTETHGFGDSMGVEGTGEPVPYTLTGLVPADDYIVVFRPDDYVNETRTGVDSSTNPTDIDFTAVVGKEISGNITGTAPGQWVWLRAWSEKTGGEGLAEILTDTDGNAAYEIRGLASADDYVVNAWTDDEKNLFYNQQTSWHNAFKVDLSGPSATGINFDFSASLFHTLSGKIEGLKRGSTFVLIDAWDVNTNAQGGAKVYGNKAFSINLPAGSYKIGIYAFGYANVFYDNASGELVYDWRDAEPVLLSEDTDIGTLTLSTLGFSISGTVTDAEDTILPGLWVSTYSSEYDIAGGASTDGNGVYQVTGLPSSDYDEAVWSIFGNFEESVTIDGNHIFQEVYLAGEATLKGSAAPGASVVLFDSNGFVNAVSASGEGKYAFSGLATGDYTVKVDTDVDDVFDAEKSVSLVAGVNTLDF